MSFTISAVPLVLLAAYLLHRAKGQVLPVVMFMSIFAAASIVNIRLGGAELGIGASYLLLGLAIAKQLFVKINRPHHIDTPKRSTTLLVLAFTAYACLSELIGPLLFSGTPVINPKFGYVAPLQWQVGVLPQLIYLIVSACLYLVAAYRTTPAELSKALDWYVAGAVLAALIAVYQYVSMKTGIPFPRELLHSNPSYAIFEGYEINGFPRMNSTFTEASTAALAFSSALAVALWKLLSSSVTPRSLGIASLILVGLLLTISTTGYLCLIFILAISLYAYLFYWRGNSRYRAAKFLLAVPAFAIIIFSIASPSARQTVNDLLQTVIFDKKSTFSYEQRTEMNNYAYSTAAETAWLGAGWGQCRASSIIPTMLGNVGLPGIGLFVALSGQPFLALLRRKRITPFHGAVLFCLSTLIVDLIISNPEINSPIIWFVLAIASRLPYRARPWTLSSEDALWNANLLSSKLGAPSVAARR